MAAAAKTWDPAGKYWENGGGGTAWDTMAFDPELNLVYIGTGNGSPWSRNKRSPAGGDNLYLASIVALNPDTGKYVWHYQETPGDNWDYTSTQPMILADLKIDGTAAQGDPARAEERLLLRDRPHQRQVHLGEELRRRELGHRLRRERPADRDRRSARRQAARQHPGPVRRAQLASDVVQSRRPGSSTCRRRTCRSTWWTTRDWKHNANTPGQPHCGLGWNIGMFVNAEPPKSKPFGRLIAWDPVAQKEAWRAEQSRRGTAARSPPPATWCSRARPTAASSPTTPRPARSSGSRRSAPAWSRRPSTYMVDGKQYVSIAVGWGGVYGLAQRATERQGPGTVYTFALGGKAPLPDFVQYQMEALVAGVKYDPAHVKEGTAAVRQQLRVLPRRAGRRPRRQHHEPGLRPARDASPTSTRFVFNGPVPRPGHARLHRQADPDEVEKIKAFIQGTADAIRPK